IARRGRVGGVAGAAARVRGSVCRRHRRVPRAPAPALMHIDEAVLEPLRERFGTPVVLPWSGEISDVEWSIATHNPARTHDVTLFILDAAGSVIGKADDARPEDRGAYGAPGADRIALIRKPHFAEDVWRPP